MSSKVTRISLMHNPWSANADYHIEFTGPASLRMALRSVKPWRHAVAVWLDGEAAWRGTEKPYVVIGSACKFGRDLISADGFMQIYGGDNPLERCERACALIADQARKELEYKKFFDGLGGFIREAVYPPPTVVR